MCPSTHGPRCDKLRFVFNVHPPGRTSRIHCAIAPSAIVCVGRDRNLGRTAEMQCSVKQQNNTYIAYVVCISVIAPLCCARANLCYIALRVDFIFAVRRASTSTLLKPAEWTAFLYHCAWNQERDIPRHRTSRRRTCLARSRAHAADVAVVRIAVIVVVCVVLAFAVNMCLRVDRSDRWYDQLYLNILAPRFICIILAV